MSRRFGGIPKGLQLVGGQRIIDRVANALRRVCKDILLSANEQEALSWLDDAVVLSDKRPFTGGLSGVQAALENAGDALCVAWDMPFVTPAVLELILIEQRKTGAAVVMPESDSPYGFEPFCAFYSAGILSELSGFLESGGGAARDFLRSIDRAHRVPLARIRQIGEPSRLFFSVNTRDDLVRANEMAMTA